MIVGDAFLYSLVRDFKESSDWKVVLIVVGLALVGEGIELLTGILGAKSQEVPTGAIVASLVGGIIGAIIGVPIFLVGSVLGLLLGTYLGALIYSLIQQGNVRKALDQSLVVLTSRVISIFAKTSVAIGMVVYLVVKII